MNPPIYTLTSGTVPLVVSIPHGGALLPEPYASAMTPAARIVADTDWHLARLYDFTHALGGSMLEANYSRYVIDLNRPASGESLYPGQTTTSLCPTETFDGEPLYRAGQEPDAAEIAERRATLFDPYHAALQSQLDRLRINGPVVLYDAHSIRSIVPRLFEGELPQFNIGDNDGATCAGGLTQAVEAACAVSGASLIVNGRFKGGWTTRHYGRPETGVHAIQMELADRGYILDPSGPVSPDNWPSPYEPERAEPMRRHLHRVLTACIAFAESQR